MQNRKLKSHRIKEENPILYSKSFIEFSHPDTVNDPLQVYEKFYEYCEGLDRGNYQMFLTYLNEYPNIKNDWLKNKKKIYSAAHKYNDRGLCVYIARLGSKRGWVIAISIACIKKEKGFVFMLFSDKLDEQDYQLKHSGF